MNTILMLELEVRGFKSTYYWSVSYSVLSYQSCIPTRKFCILSCHQLEMPKDAGREIICDLKRIVCNRFTPMTFQHVFLSSISKC